MDEGRGLTTRDERASSLSTRRARRVLVVESSADLRELLFALLQSSGNVVRLAETGERALDEATVWCPDVVVLDLGLSDVAGEDIAGALKSMPMPPFIIAYTGWSGREARAREAGCDAFVLKPALDPLIRAIDTATRFF